MSKDNFEQSTLPASHLLPGGRTGRGGFGALLGNLRHRLAVELRGSRGGGRSSALMEEVGITWRCKMGKEALLQG
jgi:hypothetical protein